MLTMSIKNAKDFQFRVSNDEEIVLVLLVWEVIIRIKSFMLITFFALKFNTAIMQGSSMLVHILKMVEQSCWGRKLATQLFL